MARVFTPKNVPLCWLIQNRISDSDAPEGSIEAVKELVMMIIERQEAMIPIDRDWPMFMFDTEEADVYG